MIGRMNAHDAAIGEPRRSRIARLSWLTGVLLLAAVVLVATHLAEERELARIVREADPLWLVAGALLQLATYVCAAGVWQRALAYLDVDAALASLVPLGLAKLFTDQAVPSIGMSGTLLVVRGLERRGVARTDAVAAMLSGLAGYYLAYFAAIAGAIAILWRHGELRPLILVPAAALALFAAGVPLAMFALRHRAVRRPPQWMERWPGVRDVAAALRDAPPGTLFAPLLLVETGVLQLAIFVLDVLTFATALRAVATPVAPSLVFATFVVASVVSSLAWVPGGLGTFEGTCVALLHLHGIALEGALAATLLLRAMTFWLPMIPGFALARREMGRSGAGAGAPPLARATRRRRRNR
jgi:uncharacterized membrane protein YbhN (UPF0104 family)